MRPFFKKFTYLLAPFMNWNTLRQNGAALLSLVILQIMQFIMLDYTTSYLNDGATFQDSQYWFTLANVFFDIACFSLQAALCQYLSDSFMNDYRKRTFEKLLDKNAFLGTDMVLHFEKELQAIEGATPKAEEGMPLLQLLSTQIKQFSEGAMALLVETTNAIISLITQLYFLCKISNSRIIAICLGFGGVIAFFISLVARKKLAIEEQQTTLETRLSSRTNAIEAHKRHIIALRAQNTELLNIKATLEAQSRFFTTTFWLNFFNYILMCLALIGFPIIVKAITPSWSLLKNDQLQNRALMDVYSLLLLAIVAYLRDLLRVFSTKIPQMLVSMHKLFAFEQRVLTWQKFTAKDKGLEISYSQKDFGLHKLTVAVPPRKYAPEIDSLDEDFATHVKRTRTNDDYIILNQTTLPLESGKTYRLHAPSGSGKSAILSALMNMSPYATGKVCFPCKETEIKLIFQEPFLPPGPTLLDATGPTLLEAICYPSSSADQSLLLVVTDLMRRLGLSQHVRLLNTPQSDWNTLSRGEQQRLMIIRALISTPKPKILLMDEATASVDSSNKAVIERIIKEYLPGTTIIYIDHNPEPESDNTQEGEPQDSLPGLAPSLRARQYRTTSATDVTIAISALTSERESKTQESERPPRPRRGQSSAVQCTIEIPTMPADLSPSRQAPPLFADKVIELSKKSLVQRAPTPYPHFSPYQALRRLPHAVTADVLSPQPLTLLPVEPVSAPRSEQ